MTAKIIIDTDIGTDVDDLWTLAVAVGRSDVDVAADRTVSLATFCRLDREGSQNKNRMEAFFVERYQEKPNCSDLDTCSKK